MALKKALQRMWGVIRYLSYAGITAVFETGPFASDPEAWPAVLPCSLQTIGSVAG